MVDTQPCKSTFRNITQEIETIQIVQPKIFESVDYYQCLVEIDHFVFRCGKTIDTISAGSHYSEYYDVTKDECKTLIRTGTLKYGGIEIYVDKSKNVNTVSTETIGKIIDQSCYPGSPSTINGVSLDRPVRNSKFKIRTSRGKASVDLEESKLTTETGLTCNYLQEQCFSADDGNVFWERTFSKSHCEKEEFLAIYEGPATKIIEYLPGKKIESYILHYDKYDFQVILTSKVSRTCGQISYQTEHPKLSVIVQEHGLPFILPYSKELLGKNTNMFTYINSKLVYAMTHVKDQIGELYNKIMFDKCQADNKIIQNMMTLATLSPHQFAYSYFGEEGYTASQRGEIIYLVKCHPVVVNYTQSIDNVCYQEIPVMHNGRRLYMAPRSRLLHKEGTVVECSSLVPVKFKLQQNWYTITPGGIITAKDPNHITIESSNPWEFEDINNFASAGIYSPEDLENIEKIILTSLNHNALSAQITRSIIGEGELSGEASVVNLMSQEELKKFGKSPFMYLFDQFLDYFGAYGQFVSIIIFFVYLFKIVLFIINPIINGKVLYNNVGFTWKLLFAGWENMVHHVLRDAKTEGPKLEEPPTKKDDIGPYHILPLHDLILHVTTVTYIYILL